MAHKVRAWSYSALEQYELCPRQYAWARIDKLPQPPSFHLERGIAIHAKAEQYLLGKIRGVPKELKAFSAEFKNLRKVETVPEQKVALTQQWELTEWFASDAWLRIIMDATVYIEPPLLVDFKTGKIYEKNEHQSRLQAIVHMCIEPEVKKVNTEMWYLDQDKIKGWTYHRGTLEDDKQHWIDRVEPLFKEKKWAPTPNNLCGWCSFKDICDAAKK